jgi:hypothetical protein
MVSATAVLFGRARCALRIWFLHVPNRNFAAATADDHIPSLHSLLSIFVRNMSSKLWKLQWLQMRRCCFKWPIDSYNPSVVFSHVPNWNEFRQTRRNTPSDRCPPFPKLQFSSTLLPINVAAFGPTNFDSTRHGFDAFGWFGITRRDGSY